MKKIYFEMSKEEKILYHIAHDLDWALCMLGEGICIDCEEDNLYGAYETAQEALQEAYEAIEQMRKAVEE